MDVSEFNKNYLNTLLDKLYKENKYLLDYFDKIWSDVLQLDQQDVNLSIESFLDNMNSILYEHGPLKRINK